MINAADVDELFASTARALQRSRVVLQERRSPTVSPSALPSTFCPLPSSTTVGIALSSSSGSGSFVDTVRSLQSLSELRGFVEAATSMQARLHREVQKPSNGLQQRRLKGQDVALLLSVTRSLKAAIVAATWRTASATASLWSSGAEGGEDEEGEGSGELAHTHIAAVASGAVAAADTVSALHSGGSSFVSSGAQITATLLFGAFCVDVALMVPRAAPSIATDVRRVFEASPAVLVSSTGTMVAEWAREGNTSLRALVQDLYTFLPRSAVSRFAARAAGLLFRPLPLKHGSAAAPVPLLGCDRLSGGQFLLPSLSCYLLEHHPSSLAATWFLQPLHTTAQNLRGDYYRSAADFQLQCQWLLHLVFVLVSSVQSAAALVPTSESVVRHVRTVQRVYEAVLMPLEKTFGHGGARQGMSEQFHRALVAPHTHVVQHLRDMLRWTTDDRRTRAWSSLLHTAHYRFLLMLEKLAQSEVAQAHGTSSTAAMQRRYEALLRENGGKFTVALLQTLAEHRQLLMEETASRAPDGQRLYRLHGGAGADMAVFVYVDDGAVFSRVGRGRSFQRMKSVEDVFRPLQ